MKDNVFFVSGIDTNIGKTFASAYIAGLWERQGFRVITQKLIQTGNKNFSEDVILHRKLNGKSMYEEDRMFLTMPEIFSYPASPHLAAKIDKREIDFERIKECTRTLSERYDRVIVEGAGGLMVPLKDDLLTIDYISKNNYPLIFVTSARLGSINHTLLSFEAIKRRNIRLHTLVYNSYQSEQETDRIIAEDNYNYIKKQLAKEFPEAEFVPMPTLIH
ncbi:MAG TPA: dethiobiotin synthase [Candidatus Onthomorpha intestinigallinarum]|uniref:ATP-dependent dethiobiotin synthetase BioD n=1 Tax=Candidatus Onthomorpha intestinigallinarum TaxID=2840880 RepID=A0A9D1RI03_9BACT|nr:dethiobiotin synthase [Candidatus Onthomorpha intestinigallinarum]